MNPGKRSTKTVLRLIGSYALLTFLYVLPIDNIFMMHRTSTIFYFIPAILLTLYFATRIIDRRVRRYLLAVGIMIGVWSILRVGKYIAFEENEAIARFIWYLYYVSLLSIPQFSFMAALSVGKPEDERLPLIQYFTGILNIICIVIVLTNDIHQQVFKFNPGFENWDADYDHEPLFWIITVWNYLLCLVYIIILFRKCRLLATRKLTWIPLVYLIFGIYGLYLLNVGKLPRMWGMAIGEFPDMACYTLGGIWVLCITIGLVPSNKGYVKLLQETSLGVRIADANYDVVYKSSLADLLTKEQLMENEPISLDANTLVNRRKLRGGYVFWQVDTTEINKINKELEENKERIAEESELIRQTNALKEKKAQIDAKSKVYDEIAIKVLPQSQQIALLSDEVENDNTKFEHNMRIISIYAAYIKRISNMMLMSSDGMISKRELVLALSESARYLNKAGIITEIAADTNNDLIPSEIVIKLYEQFEIILEQALPTLKAIQITVTDDVIKLMLEGAEVNLADKVDGVFEADDNVTYVRLYIREDGDIV